MKSDELLKLSDVLDKDVEFFLDPFTVVAEAQYSWRASPDLPKSELDRFESEASGWIGMLRWLRQLESSAHSPLKYALQLDIHSTFELAQRHAELLVEQHQLGPVPALKLVDWIEKQLDIPILFVDTGRRLKQGAISGAACHLRELGVILVNRHESAPRRYFDLAHELFHTLTWEAMLPDYRESNSIEDRKSAHRVEQLANNFAAALLMPRATLDSLIDQTRLNDAHHLAEIAKQLRVTADALGWRLLNLRMIDKPTRAELSQQKHTDVEEELPRLFSLAFVRLLHLALEKGQVSARRAAKALGMPLSELAALFTLYDLPAPFEL